MNNQFYVFIILLILVANVITTCHFKYPDSPYQLDIYQKNVTVEPTYVGCFLGDPSCFLQSDLPPGLVFFSNCTITGIPEYSGVWIVKVIGYFFMTGNYTTTFTINGIN